MGEFNSLKFPGIYKQYQDVSFSGVICNTNAKALLDSLNDESVDLVFLDPPFNLGKKYSEDYPKLDSKTSENYEVWMKDLLDTVIDALTPGGALYLYHIPEWAMAFGSFLRNRLNFRHWIAISMKNGFVRGDNLYPAHYALLYFTKGQPLNFNRPRYEPKVCRHCGKNIKDYGGYRSIIEEKGINLSDFWEDISPVRHSNKKLRTQNQLPLKMLRRVVEISGKEGSVFLDPFAGTGTGIIAALERGMDFIAGDLVESNCIIIDDRIREYIGEKGSQHV